MSVTDIRSEIKAWERAFKSKYFKDPTIQDIKDRPDIGECLRWVAYARLIFFIYI